ncbi:leucyl/phenylalanyl-tRNA--protein transferase [Parahaliea sp. F7430]|uniref:Leucyl/phenylalanyl-tRNA--protein transferase n=1 Tax=Sediminihaliea albiluteola TaxID=2758564 RepID=A0A7W2TUQ2_9GAMM|nr:leucyl/phenylalanyl-tRNA--protein transferase [Sediminihaliea albiluteola]MBA6412317.1 leucyl/phenylalanyl-tRNA--protein transferase [Sediminihaliea albiluteola]
MSEQLLRLLAPGEDFPPSSEAFDHPNGLLAAGGDLSPATLERAYRRGIFPWYQDDEPLLWWSPDPRSVLFPDQVHISRSLRKTLRRDSFGLSCDQQFAQVMSACAGPRRQQDGTWITSAMHEAYCAMHAKGLAHSIEVYREDELVGGLYGIALGGAFFGESMFSTVSDASKVALVALTQILRNNGFDLIDCQVESEHMNSLGARNMSRRDFEQALAQTVNKTVGNDWRLPPSCGALL